MIAFEMREAHPVSQLAPRCESLDTQTQIIAVAEKLWADMTLGSSEQFAFSQIPEIDLSVVRSFGFFQNPVFGSFHCKRHRSIMQPW